VLSVSPVCLQDHFRYIAGLWRHKLWGLSAVLAGHSKSCNCFQKSRRDGPPRITRNRDPRRYSPDHQNIPITPFSKQRCHPLNAARNSQLRLAPATNAGCLLSHFSSDRRISSNPALLLRRRLGARRQSAAPVK
jgi:hypothetical protein